MEAAKEKLRRCKGQFPAVKNEDASFVALPRGREVGPISDVSTRQTGLAQHIDLIAITATPIRLAFHGVIVQYIVIYIATLVAANMAVARFGPPVMPIIAFLFIGLDLTLRDRLHDRWHGQHLWPRMLALILTAGLVSYSLNPASGSIAVASVVAFSMASLADAAAYQLLARRSWSVRTNGSNIVGATVDSLVFPLLAFGSALPSIVLAQLVAKITGGMVWAFFLAWVGHSPNSRSA